MRRAIAYLSAIVVSAVLLSACGSRSDRAQRVALTALNTEAAPSNTALPVIRGNAVQGQTLTATPGTWTVGGTTTACNRNGMTCAYQWQDCTGSGCTNISGATSSSYLVQASDVSDTIGVVVTATDSGGSTSATYRPEPKCSPRNVTASLAPPAVMPAPGAMPAGSFMAQIYKRGYLLAGVDQNTKLLSYFNPRGHAIQGFEIDMLHEIANAIFGNKPNDIAFRAVTTDERFDAVKHGVVDIVADAATITCQRKLKADFSTVYIYAHQRLLVPTNSSIRTVNDLARKRVCATATSTSIDTLAKQAPRAVRYPVQQRTDCLVDLQEGWVDAITSDDAILQGFMAQDQYTKLIGPYMAPEPYGVVISRAHGEFVRFVNGVFAEMRRNGAWRSIYSRWLGGLYPTKAPPPPRYNG